MVVFNIEELLKKKINPIGVRPRMDFFSVLGLTPIGYLQNLCFPIVTVIGLDQIHLLVAVLGLK